MTPHRRGKVPTEAQTGPEGFQSLPLPHLVAERVVPPEKVHAQGALDLGLHTTEGLHAGLVCRVLRRSKMLGAEKVQVIKKLVHDRSSNMCTNIRFNLIL